MRYFKVGGMRFLRIGKLQVSWCICTGKPKRAKKYRNNWRALERAMKIAYEAGRENGRKIGWEAGRGYYADALQIENH